jgi:F-type H+-transporting ATPase subunit gamma
MGAQLRVYRRRIRSVQSTKKITRAMELIAASRIVKARSRVDAARPYSDELRQALGQAAAVTRVDHPLLSRGESPKRSAVFLVTADRGSAGAYTANAVKEAEQLGNLLREEGSEPVLYVSGRKGVSYYRFRNRELAAEWTGFSENPLYEQAREVADTLIEAFRKPTEQGGVDEIHVVYTHFLNMVSQEARTLRVLPLEVVDSDDVEAPAEGEPAPLYDFEPSAEAVLDALLPQYVAHLIYTALLESSASEQAARQRAMKSATDNAEELIKSFTRLANAARQAEITQEISEIVGGADALASATAGSE